MANNRLYIEDTETGDRIMVAKSFGSGWSWRASVDDIDAWLNAKQRDVDASFGNTSSRRSALVIRTENELYAPETRPQDKADQTSTNWQRCTQGCKMRGWS